VRTTIAVSLGLLAIVAPTLPGQTPDWVTGQGRTAQYPETTFLTGYGVATVGGEITRDRAGESAVAAARRNLIEKVRVSIQSVTSSRTEEQGAQYSSYFASAVQSTAGLEIQGLASTTYADGEAVHALVQVKREALRATYQQKVTTLKEQIARTVALARSLDQAGNTAKALDEYLSCYPLARQLEEAQSILAAVTLTTSLSDVQQQASTNETSIAAIREAVAVLLQRPLRSVEDLAWSLAYQLKGQTGISGPEPPSVLITPFVYQDTKVASPFSRFFQPLLERQAAELGHWKIVTEGQAAYVLAGSYWEQKDRVRFILTARSTADGHIAASAEAVIDGKILRATERSLKPENYKAVLADQRVFAKGEIAGGGLTLEAWTNKQVNLFTEGEVMKVLVRVNMPCYLRFIYHMANGKRVLLLNEYYMDASKVNLVYEIPQEFESAAPFGGEVLQLFARTDKFEKIKTASVDGYDIIQEGLSDVMTKTRGMKAAKQRTLQAEQRLSITTMKD
jgi:hypothetical protein